MIYVDFEMNTGGLDLRGDEIFRIGAIHVKNNRIIGEFDACCKLSHEDEELTWEVQMLTNVFNDALKGADSFNKVLGSFMDWIDECNEIQRCEGIYCYGSKDYQSLMYSIKANEFEHINNEEKKKFEATVRKYFSKEKWVDLAASITKSLSKQEIRKMSLVDAAFILDIEVDEQQLHQPLYDAEVLWKVHAKSILYCENLRRQCFHSHKQRTNCQEGKRL